MYTWCVRAPANVRSKTGTALAPGRLVGGSAAAPDFTPSLCVSYGCAALTALSLQRLWRSNECEASMHSSRTRVPECLRGIHRDS